MMEEMRELFQLKEENSQNEEDVEIYKKLQYTKIAMGSCVCILALVIMIELRRQRKSLESSVSETELSELKQQIKGAYID